MFISHYSDVHEYKEGNTFLAQKEASEPVRLTEPMYILHFEWELGTGRQLRYTSLLNLAITRLLLERCLKIPENVICMMECG